MIAHKPTETARAELPHAHVTSDSPGRTRLRVPRRRRDSVYFDRVKKTLQKQKGVKRVDANPLTGSLLVLHDLASDAIHRLGDELALFKVVAEESVTSPMTHGVLDRLQGVDQNLKDLTDNRYDLRSVAFLGLVGAAALQLFRGELFPPASSLISDAIRVLPTRGKGKV